MPNNYFRENRIRIQNAVLEFDFLIPLDSSDLPLSIFEKNAQKGKLQEIFIHDIPVEETSRPKSWILELETEFPLFSQPPKIKTVEKALIVFGSDGLDIFLLEMKNSLQPHGENGVKGIIKKIEDSIGRISLLLPLYIFGKDFNDLKIRYKGLIFYNHDNNLNINSQQNEDTETNDFVKAFKNLKGNIFLDDPIRGNHHVELFFFKNPTITTSPESFSVDFEKFFFEDWQHTACVFGDKTCPVIKKSPIK